MRRQQIIAQNNEYKRFIAPRNWKPSDEAVNIIEIFNNHRDANKKYIVSIDNDVTDYVIVPLYYYTISQRVDGVDTVTTLPTGNSSFTFTSGSTHRWALGSRSDAQSSPAYADIGSVWLHCSKNVHWINSILNNTSLRVITSESLNSVYEIMDFQGNTSLNGELNLTTHISYTEIRDRLFRSCQLTGKLVIPENITRLGHSAVGEIFQDCLFDGELYLHDKLTHITFQTFHNCNSITKIVWKAPLQLNKAHHLLNMLHSIH